jgi:acetyltransferase
MAKLEGYELILGSSVDPQFGPVLLFGSGGQLVEVYRDRALGLPPLNATLASRLMERTRIYQALKGVRGRAPVNLEQLQKLLVRFSHLVVEQPWIREIDINPLLASPSGLLALDARIVLHDPKTPKENLTRPAIRPYPTQYAGPWNLKDGTPVKIRPIRPEDEPAMVKFHEGLSDHSVFLRFFAAEKLSTRIAHERLARSCFIDYRRELALVVELPGAVPAESEIIAVGRMVKSREDDSAEIAIVVNDRYHRQGLGTEIVRRLADVARAEKLGRLVANFLSENRFMRRVLERLGFRIAPGTPGMFVAVLDL